MWARSIMCRMKRMSTTVRELLADEWPVLVAWCAVVLCYAIAAACFLRVLR